MKRGDRVIRLYRDFGNHPDVRVEVGNVYTVKAVHSEAGFTTISLTEKIGKYDADYFKVINIYELIRTYYKTQERTER